MQVQESRKAGDILSLIQKSQKVKTFKRTCHTLAATLFHRHIYAHFATYLACDSTPTTIKMAKTPSKKSGKSTKKTGAGGGRRRRRCVQCAMARGK